MKVEVNEKKPAVFKPVHLSITFEADQELQLLLTVLRHYRGRHAHLPENKAGLDAIIDALAGA